MSHSKFKAAVIGGSGYGGGEIIRRLLAHPHVELAHVASIDHVGEPLSSVHLNLEGQSTLRFEDMTPVQAAEGMDVVFFALPHEVSARAAPEVLSSTKAKIIDLSGAFRCADADTYQQWYGVEHPYPEFLDTFVYGLPELFRDQIKQSRCVANPGCFATCIELGLLPLARNGLLNGSVETVGITGSSGSGVAPKPGTHHPIRANNIKSYQTLKHTQTPEIIDTVTRAGGENIQMSFVPVSAPLARGLWGSSFAHVPSHVSEDKLREVYRDTFASEPFVRVPEQRSPEVAAVVGSNYAEVSVVLGPVRDDMRVVTCMSALDNLIKGGAGQAVQNMNILLGLDETTVLADPGSWP